jgi:hypothetical protein
MSPAEWTILLFTGITSLATGITAFVVWNQWRVQIQVEWKPAWSNLYERSIPPRLEAQITVRNYRRFGIAGKRVEVSRCPVLDLRVGDPNRRKHDSWKPQQSPLPLDIEPGASGSVTAFLFIDWAALAERRSVKKRPKSSTDLRIQISVASKARRRWTTKASTTIDIPNEVIAKAAIAAKR